MPQIMNAHEISRLSPIRRSISLSPDRKRRDRSRSRSLRKYKRRTPPSRSRSPSRRRSYSRSPRRRSEQRPRPCRCIGVFGLSILTDEDKIREIFGKFGPIERVQMVIDAHTKRSRGFCFVYFDDVADAKVAKEKCSGIEIDGRNIRVDFSITQRPHTPTPGRYMGKITRNYSRNYEERRNGRSPSPHYRDNRRKRYNRSRSFDRSKSRSYSPRNRRYRRYR